MWSGSQALWASGLKRLSYARYRCVKAILDLFGGCACHFKAYQPRRTTVPVASGKL